jgi:hypothetical protein
MDLYEQSVSKISAIWRGYWYRSNNLPNSIKYLKHFLIKNNIKRCGKNEDGRINSVIDETNIIKILKKNKKLKKRIKKAQKRHWFDIKIYDYRHGWLPINIKSTTTMTSDNTGNLAMCLWALTNYQIVLSNSYNNGQVSKLLIDCLQNNELNENQKRDYYFLVINKNDKCDIIINSFKGLSKLTPNVNNLPFQVKWKHNKKFKYKNLIKVKNTFVLTLQKQKPSWKESFLQEIRMIK